MKKFMIAAAGAVAGLVTSLGVVQPANAAATADMQFCLFGKGALHVYSQGLGYLGETIYPGQCIVWDNSYGQARAKHFVNGTLKGCWRKRYNYIGLWGVLHSDREVINPSDKKDHIYIKGYNPSYCS